jgi:hypothetical protein
MGREFHVPEGRVHLKENDPEGLQGRIPSPLKDDRSLSCYPRRETDLKGVGTVQPVGTEDSHPEVPQPHWDDGTGALWFFGARAKSPPCGRSYDVGHGLQNRGRWGN